MADESTDPQRQQAWRDQARLVHRRLVSDHRKARSKTLHTLRRHLPGPAWPIVSVVP